MKITLAQIASVAGDIEGNTAKIVEAAHKAKASTLVIFPELAVSGICSAEMFKSPGFIDKCEKALDKIAAKCENVGLLVGCPVGKYNAAVYLFQGQRKVFKKKYLEDFERGVFEPSDADELLQIGCHKYAVTIGKDLENTNDDEFLLQNRMDELMPLAPDVIINIAAVKGGVDVPRRRRNTLRQNVLKTERPLVFVNNVASKKEATFDGGSMIFGYESYVVASAPFFEEAVVDVNLECLISMKHEDEQQDYVL
jgi:NAD+ synthase (glutamine-hydrolysing)